MHVLLTNDDGVDAPGLLALLEALRPLCDLTVVAPRRQRSASGLAITLDRAIPVLRLPSRDGVAIYACDGTPADCAALGIYALAGRPVDLVISGINDGPNMGEDILYSGTVGAAIEARIAGAPAAAISALQPPDGAPTRFNAACEVAVRLLHACREGLPMPDHAILNINVPPLPFEALRGVRVVEQGHRSYGPQVRVETAEDGTSGYWVYGPATDAGNSLDTDVGATRAGYVAITPVTYRLTCDRDLPGLRASAMARLLELHPPQKTPGPPSPYSQQS